MVRVILLLIAAAGLPVISRDTNDSRILANDNRAPAGRLQNSILTIRLEAREGIWYPDAEAAPGLPTYAFAEVGKPAQVPGPLIRVPAGTTVRVSITNRIAGQVLRVHGLHSRPGGSIPAVRIASGETQTFSLKLDAAGTYFYWAATTDSVMARRTGLDTQLAGAIVVDSAGASQPRDRVFVITQFLETFAASGGPMEGALFISAINGKSWPHTERLDYSTGDTIHWRWINASLAQHPMHLHGFYYRIHSRGDGVRDSSYSAGREPQVVTDRVLSPGTMTMTWVPERAGNWLFHCHVPGHVAPHLPLDRSAVKAKHHVQNHALEGMGGLMLGIHVKGRENAAETVPTRRLRMLAVRDSASTADRPVYRFTLDRPDLRAQTGIGLMTSPVLVLKRNESVAITVVNTLDEPTAVHWHGIELESYYDGVAGFGGVAGRISPVIEPGDSFIARFTPPRSGTFIYHTHVDEPRQEPAGLSGVIAVVDDAFDARTDHPVLLAMLPARRGDFQINGAFQPPPLQFRAGATHKLRIVNMMTGPPRGALVTLMRDSSVLSWRAVAKDGASLSEALAKTLPSRVQVTIGETYDFEVTLMETGDYRLEARIPGNAAAPVRVLPIHVR